MAKVIWTDPALSDVRGVFDYLVQQSRSAQLAERICLELLKAAYDRLSVLPDSGALVQELTDIGARELYRHSYRIIYVHRAGACYVIQCIHSSRDLVRHIEPERWAGILGDDGS
jgi:plasmid stabilization system protein ParE